MEEQHGQTEPEVMGIPAAFPHQCGHHWCLHNIQRERLVKENKRYSQQHYQRNWLDIFLVSGRKEPKPTHKHWSLKNFTFVGLGRSRLYCKHCFVSTPWKRKDTWYGCGVSNVYLSSNACYNEYYTIHQHQQEKVSCCRMWTGFHYIRKMQEYHQKISFLISFLWTEG